MSFRKRYILVGLALLGLSVVTLLGMKVYQSRFIHVEITNSGSQPMMGVVISFGGGQINLGEIAPGASASGSLIPRADSDVGITFKDATSQTQTIRVDVYVTKDFHGTIHIDIADSQLKSVKDNLGWRLL